MPEQSQPHSNPLSEMTDAFLYAQGYDVGGWDGHMRKDEVQDRFYAAKQRLEEQLEAAQKALAQIASLYPRGEPAFEIAHAATHPSSASIDAATSTQSGAFPEGNDGVMEAEESLEQRWGRAILAAEDQRRKARDA